MSEITIEAIAKTVGAIVKQELEPVNFKLATIEDTVSKHTTQLDGIAKDVKTLMDHKTVTDHLFERPEKWGVKVGEKVDMKLEL